MSVEKSNTKIFKKFSLRINVKPKTTRGATDDPAAVLEAMVEAWDDLQEAVSGLGDDDATQMKDFFNELNPDVGTLGDILFGDADEFQETVNPMDLKEKKTYVKAIVETELIDLNNN